MIWMPLACSIAAFLVCALMFYFLQRASQSLMARNVRQRLHQAVEGEGAVEEVAPGPSDRRDLMPLLTQFLHQQPFGQRLQDYLRSANLRFRASEFLCALVGIAVVTGGLAFVLTGELLVAIPIGLFGGIVPLFLVRIARGKRLLQINVQLQDWLMLMASCMRSGHSWTSALEMAARDMEPPICEELARLLQETRRGISWEEGFKNLLRRAPSVDLELIVVAILTQREIGGNLGEVLSKILHTIQERIRLQGEVRVLSSQGVLSGVVVGLLPLGLGTLLTLMEPTFLNPMLENRIGQFMLGGAVMLQILGGLWIKSLIVIDY